MSILFAGLGGAVPAYGVSQADAIEAARRFCPPDPHSDRILPVLYRKSGVQQRYSSIFTSADGPAFERQSLFTPLAGPHDRGPSTGARMRHYRASVGELGHAAATRALEDAATPAREITHLITVSCSGFHAPGLDVELMQSLGLSATVQRTHVGFMGCHGAMNGLRVADAIATAEPDAKVLLCAAELCTLHCQYGWDPDAVLTNALFADGAAAVVACAATRPNAARKRWKLVKSGSVLIPDSRDAMTWNVGDHGFEMTLSSRVPDLIAAHLEGWLSGFLAGRGLTLADVRSWAVHPGGPRILQAVGETLRLPPEAMAASRAVLAEYGNMSSPTVLFVLERLLRESAPGPCVALGFGPGLAAEAMLLEVA